MSSQEREAATAQRLEDTYDLTNEHSHVAVAFPLPFNILTGDALRAQQRLCAHDCRCFGLYECGSPALTFVLMRSHLTTRCGCPGLLDFVGLLWRWNQLKRKYPDCPFGRRIDLYLSRNAALPDKGTPLCLFAARAEDGHLHDLELISVF